MLTRVEIAPETLPFSAVRSISYESYLSATPGGGPCFLSNCNSYPSTSFPPNIPTQLRYDHLRPNLM